MSSLRKHSPHLLRTALHVSLKVATSAPDVLADIVAEIKKVGVAETARDRVHRLEPAVSKWAHQVMEKLPLMSGLVMHVLCPQLLRLGHSLNAILVELQQKQLPLVCVLPAIAPNGSLGEECDDEERGMTAHWVGTENWRLSLFANTIEYVL